MDTVKENIVKMSKLKKVAKISLLLGMLCFLLPFAMVSCQEQTVAEASGIELLTGKSIIHDFDIDKKESTQNIHLIIAFLFGIGGMILRTKQYQDGNTLYSGICAVCSLFFMFLFAVTFRSYYGLSEYGNYVEVEFRYGFVLSLIFLLTSAAGSIWAYYQECYGKAMLPEPPCERSQKDSTPNSSPTQET